SDPDPAHRRRPRTTGCPSRAPLRRCGGSDPDHVTRAATNWRGQAVAVLRLRWRRSAQAQVTPLRSSADQDTEVADPVDHHSNAPAAATLATPMATNEVRPVSMSYRLSPAPPSGRSVLRG